ncbi:MAG: hypothetical protein GY865_06945 [candidate division Zixibacteria bacterium]|nr:hypothetical protein [candidate division Zixibacteria bacterium]
MKTRNYSLLVILLILSISIVLSCSNSTGPEEDHSFPAAIDSVATDITLYVNTSGVIIASDTLEMNSEDTITIDYAEGNTYFIYASADGFYTELYYCANGETITVDLDAVPNVPNSVTGVIFISRGFPHDQYCAERNIVLTVSGGSSITGTTDSLGRYGFSNLSECDYILHSAVFGIPKSFNIINTTGTDYNDLSSMAEDVIYAPNVYLYPETTSDISVDISFPNGGRVVESKPPYNNGWNVNVTPEGIIDGEYEYLFYDTKQPIALNYHSGWLLDGSNLENEIRYLLLNLGFIGREIDDFVEYWLPKFGTTPYLAVYPQDVESLITLTINPVPDNLLRMIFFFRPLNESIELEELPLPDAIQRDGFTAVEWGGILLDE